MTDKALKLRSPSVLPSTTFSSYCSYGDHRDLHSFPTRRSSDLCSPDETKSKPSPSAVWKNSRMADGSVAMASWGKVTPSLDRKSTRLNSSHSQISYAVFCLKKKKKLSNTQNVVAKS